MTRRNPPAKWVLPEVVDPPDHICITVPVPNDRMHIGAFFGALYNLTSARFWQDNTSHTALQVARVWRDIFDELKAGPCSPPTNLGIAVEDCDLNLRIKPDDPCVIQIRCGEDSWEDWYDPRSCIPGAVTQPPPGGELPTGECLNYSVALQANNSWRLPISVSENYKITISNVNGAASDGTSTWYCPNGQPFVLGFCVGSPGHAMGDPDAVSYHMQLIATDGTNFYGAFNTSFVIPPGTADTFVEFQLNDDPLADNRGSISFDVEVCNQNANVITHIFDFTTGQHGWTITDDGGATASYVAATGFKANNPDGVFPHGAMTVRTPDVGQYTIIGGEIIYIATAAVAVPTGRNVAFNRSGSLVIQGNLVNSSGTVTTPIGGVSGIFDEVLITLDADTAGTDAILTRVTFVMQGTSDPFAGL